MRTDDELRCSASQAVSASGETLATNSIDLSAARNLSIGEELFAHFTIETQPVSVGGSETITFEVLGDADGTFTAGEVVLGSSGAILETALTAGTRVIVAFNPDMASTGYRYLTVRYTCSGAMATTAAAITADFVAEPGDGETFYPGGAAADVWS